MNILHITPYVPSKRASHAGGVCMGKQAEWLIEHHDYHLLTFVNSKQERELLTEYGDRASGVSSNTILMGLRSILHPRVPFLFSVRTSPIFTLKLVHLIKKFKIDAIHAEYTAMGQYQWIKKLFPHLQFNLTEHDVTQQSFSRQKEGAKGLRKFFLKGQYRKVVRCERKYVAASNTVFSFSQKDCALIDSLYRPRHAAIWLAPYYGVEVEHADKSPKQPIVCFVGQMGREENNEAALRLIDIFDSFHLGELASLKIIGAHPSQELLSRQSDSIVVTGFVDDINSCISECKVAAFPLVSGAGVKLKVLLAASLGLPVITTDIGAEGIDEAGESLLLAETNEDFAVAIRALLENEEYYHQKARAIYSLVERDFSWNHSEETLSKIYPS